LALALWKALILEGIRRFGLALAGVRTCRVPHKKTRQGVAGFWKV
jgi:hypothetical protein